MAKKKSNKEIMAWQKRGIYDIAYNGKSWYNSKMRDIKESLKKKEITKKQAIELYELAQEESSYNWENKYLESLDD